MEINGNIEVEVKLYYLTELLNLAGEYNTSNKISDFIPYLSNSGDLPQWYLHYISSLNQEDSDHLQKILSTIQKFNPNGYGGTTDLINSRTLKLVMEGNAKEEDNTYGFSNKTLQDALWLIKNKDKNLGSSYHDAGSCWELIEAFRFLIDNLSMIKK